MYMDSLSSNVNNFSYNIHVHLYFSKIYWEFYHSIIYMANEGHYIIILHRSFNNLGLFLDQISNFKNIGLYNDTITLNFTDIFVTCVVIYRIVKEEI